MSSTLQRVLTGSDFRDRTRSLSGRLSFLLGRCFFWFTLAMTPFYAIAGHYWLALLMAPTFYGVWRVIVLMHAFTDDLFRQMRQDWRGGHP